MPAHRLHEGLDDPVPRAVEHGRGLSSTETLDLVFSQATLEHVDGLPDVYRAMYDWLKPGAYMSHQIDAFKCQGELNARDWTVHGRHSDCHAGSWSAAALIRRVKLLAHEPGHVAIAPGCS